MATYTDNFTGTNGAAWSGTYWTTAKRSGASASTIDTNRGKQALSTSGNYTDYETQRHLNGNVQDGMLEGTINWPTDNEQFNQIWFRGESALQNNGYFFSIEPSYNNIRFYKRVGGTQTALGSNTAFTLAAGTTYNWKVEWTGSTLRAKVWTGSEPGAWTVSITDTSFTAAGHSGLGTDGGLAATAYTVFWDDVTLTTPTPTLTATGSITATGALIRNALKRYTGSITPAGVYSALKVVQKVFTASITGAGVFIKRANKAFTGSVTAIGFLIKRLSRWFTASITPTGFYRNAFVRFFTGSITTAGAFTKVSLGRVFGRPGIITTVARKAGEVTMRIRRT